MELYKTLRDSFAQEGITSPDLEELLSVSLIIIDDLYQQHFPDAMSHRPGPNSKLADSEVITIAWVGEMFGIDSEQSWYNLVKKEFSYLFPYNTPRKLDSPLRWNLA